MGKLNIFEITLTNFNGVYFAGQNLEGHVTVELNDGMKMRGVRLKFSGRAYVHWTEQHSTGSGKNRRTETRHYSATEQYFNFELLLFGPGTGSTVLQAGRHTFPFVYQLPMNLPSSYESHIGNVRYHIKGTIDKPWKFDHSTKKVFTVVSMLDLNTHPSAPVTSYHATTKTRTISSDVASIRHGPIDPYGSDVWSGDRLHIPAVPPSYLVGCSIIDIRYILMLEVDPAGPAFDLEVPLEIIIGTIPLRTFIPTYAQQFPPSGGALPPVGAPPPGGAEGGAISPSAPDLPPPSYAECVFGKVAVAEEDDNEYTKGDKDFAPVYTYYDWSKK